MTFNGFVKELRRQRWDDHRYYHQSRINQTLHLISAISFLCAYVVVFANPMAGVLIAWGIGMVTRQTGHYVFEPSSFDKINNATNAHKETIKVGFNQKRKTILIACVVLAPLVLAFDPTLLGLFEKHTSTRELADHVALIWLALALAAILIRMAQLTVTRSFTTALVWVLKIATDPFHNVHIYWKSPYYLFVKGQLYDPLDEAEAHEDDEEEAELPA
ncbi:MAG: hypothetical protein NW223_07900 [Hyphomicrobiaceae bacterium]|nr:hypothetical protein [Hyphomicrobiaceae bacterium]